MKLFKILLLVIILSIALFSNVYATETEENLSDSLQVLSSMLTTNTDDVVNEAHVTEETTIQNTPTTSQVVTTSSSSEDDGLSISDIINIILIAVGLVLIFLAVAILLRAK